MEKWKKVLNFSDFIWDYVTYQVKSDQREQVQAIVNDQLMVQIGDEYRKCRVLVKDCSLVKIS